MTPAASRKAEAVFATVLLAASLFLLREALAIGPLSRPSAPGGVPVVAAGVMAASVLFVLVDALLRSPQAPDPAEALAEPPAGVAGLWPLALAVALAVGFAVLVDRLGFLLAGTLFLTLAFRAIGRRRWRVALPVAVAVILVIWLLFRLVFQVLLPEGIVPERAILATIEDWLAARRAGGR